MFRDYETFLCVLDKKLNGFFENQKEYICCSKGCSLCCKTGVYPISEVEFLYIKYALERLPDDVRENILSKIRTLKAQKAAESGDKNWTYVCPFLEEEKCLVYTFRPIVCRTFGLPYFDDNNKIKEVVNNIYKALDKFSINTEEIILVVPMEIRQVAYVVLSQMIPNIKVVAREEIAYGYNLEIIDRV